MTDTPRAYNLRQAHLSDLPAVYSICLKTANSGLDGTDIEDDPDAPGHLYVGPYVALEPEHAVVLDGASGVVGYAVGALDTVSFYHRMERDWLPVLRGRIRHPGTDEALWQGSDRRRSQIHQRRTAPAALLERYPSHVHINLLSEARGGGWGRMALETVMQRLEDAGSPGVHLGVGRTNEKAQAFYRALGLQEYPLAEEADTVIMVKRFLP
ncbi:GNAT family N-acetyltransferase [Kaistia dalseonensis]|uniref:Ribosomal protein S18 acetylase RimI-like enzyme n=1 Tax=Kaistia dalseonensis TaxID=410840 RepID=A0ABU0H8H0_9HYPH|nr:GNAT family N-acetyltransferase [Kaistia dalseonensis]MCX5495999.1 GNAT family N-acetyltransferase [Kaistia dalseonensis]MDQ0438602.1 ribosomal protein S18 acetylase RimI-like enzyme [Kaistia dalseonensis]